MNKTQHKVTQNEILEACIRYKWTLKGHQIRTVRGNRCPLQVFTNNLDFYRGAAEAKGVSKTIINQTIGASDGYAYSAVREKMLRAFGLKEKK